MIAVLVFGAGCFALGAAVAYWLSGAASSVPPRGVAPEVRSMKRWQQGMDALRRADGSTVYLWDLFEAKR